MAPGFPAAPHYGDNGRQTVTPRLDWRLSSHLPVSVPIALEIYGRQNVSRNIRLYPWFQFFRNLLFWQAIWFLFFQEELSAAEAIALYAIFDIATTILEVPSGYLSDRLGRRITLILSAVAATTASLLLAFGEGFLVFALAQFFLGAGSAFVSGTDGALLYESLAAEDRADEIERHELKAWRFGFTALAASALTGGMLASDSAENAFLATAITSAIALVIALSFREPVHSDDGKGASGVAAQAHAVVGALRNPILAWFFILGASMYVLSHVPFVFGQPFILQTLDKIGLAGDAPNVSGLITAAMMVVSVGASWLAQPLCRWLGAGRLFLVALSLQIGLIAVLAVSVHPFAIAILLLRMVPDALERPFLVARAQPLLNRAYRATYWSVQSLVSRTVLALSLFAISLATPSDGTLSHDALRDVLVWYIVAGLAVLAGLAVTVRLPGRTD